MWYFVFVAPWDSPWPLCLCVCVRVKDYVRDRAVECWRPLGLQHATFVCLSLWFGSRDAFMHYEYGVLVGHMSVYRLLCVLHPFFVSLLSVSGYTGRGCGRQGTGCVSGE